MRVVVSIDPGLNGAMCAMTWQQQLLALEDLPIIRDLSLAWIDGARLQSMIETARLQYTDDEGETVAVIERVGSMPKQGVASSFKFGVGFGSCLSTLQVCRLPLHFASPAKWKRELGLSGDKNASLDKARLLFPDADLSLKKHEGRAEALLLAHWYITRRAGASQ